LAFTLRIRDSIALNATETMDLGSLSRMPADGTVTIYATSTTDGGLTATFLVGQEIILDAGVVNVAATTGRVDTSSDLLAQGIGLANDPLTLRVTNTTGGALVFSALIVIA
jgi:hypothetical protein